MRHASTARKSRPRDAPRRWRSIARACMGWRGSLAMWPRRAGGAAWAADPSKPGCRLSGKKVKNTAGPLMTDLSGARSHHLAHRSARPSNQWRARASLRDTRSSRRICLIDVFRMKCARLIFPTVSTADIPSLSPRSFGKASDPYDLGVAYGRRSPQYPVQRSILACRFTTSGKAALRAVPRVRRRLPASRNSCDQE